MDIHVLDIVIWVIVGYIMMVFIPEEYNDKGDRRLMIIMFIYTILYMTFFAIWPDWNWFDIFNNLRGPELKINFVKWKL